MDDRAHSDLNAKVRAIVDDSIADLLLIGMESKDAAAALMAIQAMIRIDGQEQMASVAEFAASLIVDEGEGGDEKS